MRVGLLWYAAHDNEPGEVGRGNRLAPLSTAIGRQGFDVVAIPYRHADHEAAARILKDCSAVMTWVNPIEDGKGPEARARPLWRRGLEGGGHGIFDGSGHECCYR